MPRSFLNSLGVSDAEGIQLLARLIEHMADAISIISADGTILFQSPSVERMLGYTAQEMIGRSTFEFVHPDDREGTVENLAAILASPGSTLTAAYRYRHRDGHWLYLEAKATNLVHDPVVRGVILARRDVTDRVLAEVKREEALSALRDREESYRIVAETALDSIISIDQSGTIVFANSASERIFGYSVEELTGSFFTLLMPERLREFWSTALAEYVRTGVRTMDWTAVHLSGWRKDGTEFPAEMSFSSYLHDGRITFTAIIRDVTERRRLEREREQLHAMIEWERERLATILHRVPIGIWESTRVPGTRQQVTTFINESYRNALGYTLEEWSASPDLWMERMHPDDREMMAQAMMQYPPPAEARNRFRMFTKDGRMIWLDVQLALDLDENNEVAGTIGFALDVTDKRRAEEALQQAHDMLEARVLERTAELAEMMRRLEEAYANQKRFIADASHDIRTPLTSVRTELDLLLHNQSIDQNVRSALDRITRQIRRLGYLTDDLLMLATLDTKETLPCSEEMRVDDLLLQAISDLSALAAERGVRWNVNFGDLVEIRCDGVALKRALTNVLENAAKYSPLEAVVDVDLTASDEAATIVVRDRGVGIRPEDLPHIFDRFYRGDQTRSTQGTGLGLAIVKAVVDRHAGAIVIESAPDAGTTVTITLPRQ